MGARVTLTDTGVECELHVFDSRPRAEGYLTIGRMFSHNYTDEVGGVTFEHYLGRLPCDRAALRERDGKWHVAFWTHGPVRVESAAPYDGKPVWHGVLRHNDGDKWIKVTNAAGNAISYVSPEDAYNGANHALWCAGPEKHRFRTREQHVS